MRVPRRCLRVANRQSGYALLLVMFFLALLIVSLAEVSPTALSVVQREKETEMIWRGQQYARGVRMYYNKMRRFPTALDDLTKPKTGIRFMRQAYKDPMNQVDGSWRLIYVGPNGQLIGSLNQYTIGTGTTSGSLGSSGGSGIANLPPSNPSFSSGFSGLGQGSSRTANSLNSAFGSTQLGGNTQSSWPSAGGPDTADTSSATNTDQGSLTGGLMDSNNTFGGNIIGVGSKVNKRSFIVYQRAKNYRLFEFVWDPAQGISMGNSSAGIGKPVQSLNDFGITPSGTNMSDSPFAPGRNPAQNPAQNPTQDPFQNQNLPQN